MELLTKIIEAFFDKLIEHISNSGFEKLFDESGEYLAEHPYVLISIVAASSLFFSAVFIIGKIKRLRR